jgi:hypothetical protein
LLLLLLLLFSLLLLLAGDASGADGGRGARVLQASSDVMSAVEALSSGLRSNVDEQQQSACAQFFGCHGVLQCLEQAAEAVDSVDA